MSSLVEFYADYPFWTWIAAAAALLAIEITVGSGYLLWAAASAGVVALLTLTGVTGVAVELGVFAVLTIVSSLAANRFFPPRPEFGPDINDATPRIVGRAGQAVGAFIGGRGRVFVEGKEWAAEAEGDAPAEGDTVVVVAVQDGASLRVRKSSAA